MQEAWPGQTKLVVTLQKEAVNHRVTTVWESEHSENSCVCVFTYRPGFASVLTAWALSNAAVLSVPVPQQQGGISGARQDVAVSSDVRLGASQTRHHITMPKHYLSQFACKREKNK